MKFGNVFLDLTSPKIMGILNVTPDSFSDGGKFVNFDTALSHASNMVRQGAAIIDVGGESTRPGAQVVDVQQELDRTIPLIERISRELEVIVSIDTSKADVMRHAIDAGATLVNDVCALQLTDALDVVANSDVSVCLMHMQGQPRTMQNSPQYDDVVLDVLGFLEARIKACANVGIDNKRIIIDPGFGFGKTLAHNYTLLASLQAFESLNVPVLAGISRKSMIKNVIKNQVDDRLSGSLSAATIALMNGAQILRVHDVEQTADVIAVFNAMRA